MSLSMYNGYLVTHWNLHLTKTLFSNSVVKFITFSSVITFSSLILRVSSQREMLGINKNFKFIIALNDSAW